MNSGDAIARLMRRIAALRSVRKTVHSAHSQSSGSFEVCIMRLPSGGGAACGRGASQLLQPRGEHARLRIVAVVVGSAERLDLGDRHRLAHDDDGAEKT